MFQGSAPTVSGNNLASAIVHIRKGPTNTQPTDEDQTKVIYPLTPIIYQLGGVTEASLGAGEAPFVPKPLGVPLLEAPKDLHL